MVVIVVIVVVVVAGVGVVVVVVVIEGMFWNMLSRDSCQMNTRQEFHCSSRRRNACRASAR